jgi:hypothetical protein
MSFRSIFEKSICLIGGNAQFEIESFRVVRANWSTRFGVGMDGYGGPIREGSQRCLAQAVIDNSLVLTEEILSKDKVNPRENRVKDVQLCVGPKEGATL